MPPRRMPPSYAKMRPSPRVWRSRRPMHMLCRLAPTFDSDPDCSIGTPTADVRSRVLYWCVLDEGLCRAGLLVSPCCGHSSFARDRFAGFILDQWTSDSDPDCSIGTPTADVRSRVLYWCVLDEGLSRTGLLVSPCCGHSSFARDRFAGFILDQWSLPSERSHLRYGAERISHAGCPLSSIHAMLYMVHWKHGKTSTCCSGGARQLVYKVYTGCSCFT